MGKVKKLNKQKQRNHRRFAHLVALNEWENRMLELRRKPNWTEDDVMKIHYQRPNYRDIKI